MSTEYKKQVPQLAKFFPNIRWARVTANAPKVTESLSVPTRPEKKSEKRENVLPDIASEVAEKTSTSSNSSNGRTILSDDEWETNDESDTTEKMRTAGSLSFDNIVEIPSKVLDNSYWDADEFFMHNIPVAVSTPAIKSPKKVPLDKLPEESPEIPLFFTSSDENETVYGTVENVNAVFSLTKISDLSEDTNCKEVLELENEVDSLNSGKNVQHEQNVPNSMLCECSEIVSADVTGKRPHVVNVSYHGSSPKTSKGSKCTLRKRYDLKGKPGRVLYQSEVTPVQSEKTAEPKKQVKRPKKNTKKNIPICCLTTVDLVASPRYLKVVKLSKEELAKIKIDDITLI